MLAPRAVARRPLRALRRPSDGRDRSAAAERAPEQAREDLVALGEELALSRLVASRRLASSSILPWAAVSCSAQRR